jgi:pullulanase
MYLNVATKLQAWAISGNATSITTVPTPTQILDSLLNVQQAYWLDRQRSPSSRSLRRAAIPMRSVLQSHRRPVGDAHRHHRRNEHSAHGWRNLTAEELLRYPQLSGYTVLQLPANTLFQRCRPL